MKADQTSDEFGADFLVGGGEMGERMRLKDWAQTVLGPADNWSSSLKTSISIVLASRFAMVVAWGADFRFFYNDRYRPVLGATKHPGALGTPAKEIFPEAWPFIGPLFESTRRGESVALDDVLIPLDRNGYLENCYFTLSYSPIRDESGGVGGMLAVVAETTERVEGERRLKTLRELARRAAEATTLEQACSNAAATLGENPIDVPFALFYIVEADGKTARLIGSSGIAANLEPTPPTVDLSDRSGKAWPLAEIVETRDVRIVDDLALRFGDLPGGPYPEPANTAVIAAVGRPGQPRADAILIFGVSPRRALDDSYRGFFDLAADHVLTGIRNALAHQEERDRAEALAELDRAKTAFFNNVSHEFRTPLTLMLGPLEDALSAPDASSPDTRIHIEVAHRNSLRLLKLVNTLLDFSRIEAGRIQAVFEPVDLGAYTAELASLFRSTMERAGLEFHVDCPTLGERVYIDREMWEKIVFNLLSNAFKFTFEGRIELSLRRAEQNAELIVRDTGTGIPAEDIPHLFERFYRVKDARGRTYEGTGIGLALVRELTRLHGGSIDVTSRVDAGTSFVVTIPLGCEHLPADRIGAPRTIPSTAIRGDVYIEEALRWLPQLPTVADAQEGKPYILLADDNADMRDYVARLLSTRFRVTCCFDGQAALEAAQQEKPDLILSDIMMPRLDGVGLLKALRADAKLRSVPVILLSARAGEDARVEGLSAGADDYLVKPFGARELMARVETHLQMSKFLRQSADRERARAEELEALMAAVPAAVFIATDPECRTITGSRTAYDLLRIPSNTNLSMTAGADGRPLRFKVFKDGAELPLQDLPVRSAARGAVIRDMEVELVFDDGSQVYLYGSAVPLRDSNGELRGSIAAFVDITERKRAEQRLALQYEVARIVTGSEVLEDALARILKAVGETLSWDAGCVWTVDRQSQTLHCVTVWQRPPFSLPKFESASRALKIEKGIGLPGRVWKTGSSVWIDDVIGDNNFPRLNSAAEEGLHTALAFPVLLHGEPLCVIEFYSRKTLRPDTELLHLMDAVGSQLGQFIERKRMEEERALILASEQTARSQLEEEREILQTLNRTGQMLSGKLELQNLVQALTDAATELTGAQFGSFFYNVLDDRGASYVLSALSGVSREHFENLPMPRNAELFGSTFRGEGIVRVADVTKDPRYGKTPPYDGMAKGQLRVCSYLAVPVISRSGEVLGGLFFGHAEPGVFGERHEMIVEGLAAQAAIAIDNARLYETAQKAKGEAELANRLKDEFLATVSHELRTPLNAMLGWARLMRTGRLDDQRQAQALEVIERNALAQQQIIEDILDVSRIITGKLRLEISPIEVRAAVEAAVDSMKPSADAKGVMLQSITDTGNNVILGDTSRIQQIIWNLLSNAVKFTPRGGRVQVAVQRGDSYVEIAVRDTGKGIHAEFLPYAFERFRQADSSSTRQFGGLGLGLAIVRHLTELHGGTAHVSSPGENQGSTFTIRFPLAVTPQNKDRLLETDRFLQTAERASGSTDLPRLDRIKVLAVDDESDARALLSFVLSECHAEVRTVASVEAAINLIAEWKPDVLISDIGMPGEDGYALIRRVRSLPPERGGTIPAAALTAYARSDDRVRALSAGYQSYVTKPVEPSELVAVVASLAGLIGKATTGGSPP